MTEPTAPVIEPAANLPVNPNPNPPAPGNEPPAPPTPTPEQRVAELEKKVEDVLKGFYATSQEKAELSRQLENARFERDQLAITAAQATRSRTVFDEIDDQINANKDDPMKVVELQAQKAVLQAQAEGLRNSVNSVKTIVSAHSPNLSPTEREELNRSLYVNGDPARGFRDVNVINQFLADPDAAIEAAKDRALGKQARSGKLKEQWQMEQETERKRKEDEQKRQASLTSPGGGVPPTPLPQEKIKVLEKQVVDSIVNAPKSPV